MKDSRPVLIIGRNGLVSWELRRALAPFGNVVSLGHDRMDLADPDSILRNIRDLSPGLIVNAAAWTDTEKAEDEPDAAMAVNGTAPGILAEEAGRLGVPLVHYSTEAVFGTPQTGDDPPRGYTEDDPVSPVSAYALSKAEGDRAIMAVDSAFLIFRVTWVYSDRGRNFLAAIRGQVERGGELRVVDDQVGNPTWARMIAGATATALARTWLVGGADAVSERRGLYHLASAGQTSWHGFASQAMSLLYGEGEVPPVAPVPTGTFPTRVDRPAFSVLDCSAVREIFGIALPDWQTQLGLCLDQ